MNKNLRILLLVSLLFGLTTGIYDFGLPFYLDEQGISFRNMGVIFAVAALFMFLFRIYIGHLSDLFGRKLYFSLALFGSAIANLLTPITANIIAQSLLKTVRESAFMVKETIQSVLVYEHGKKRYTDWIGKTRGWEYFCEGLGTLLVGLLLLITTFRGALVLGGGLLLLSFLIFIWLFEEKVTLIGNGNETRIDKSGTVTAKTKPNDVAARQNGLLNRNQLTLPHLGLYSFDLPRELKLIAIAGLITSIGTSTTHCFVMPLFFAKKFHASPQLVSIIMALHRLVLGLPMIFVSKYLTRNLKWIYIGFLGIQSIAISGTALIPNLWFAAVVWFLHDLVGGGIWAPAYYALMQQYSRSATRALDTSKVMALSQLGWIIGPLLAGYLFPISVNYPFLFGGIISLFALFVLIRL